MIRSCSFRRWEFTWGVHICSACAVIELFLKKIRSLVIGILVDMYWLRNGAIGIWPLR
jgi:hypothetical protein